MILIYQVIKTKIAEREKATRGEGARVNRSAGAERPYPKGPCKRAKGLDKTSELQHNI